MPNPKIQKKLNLKIKYREGFRPFAPSVLSEDVQDYFDLEIFLPKCYQICPGKKKKEKTNFLRL